MDSVQGWAIMATAGVVGVTLGLGAVKRITANGPFFPSMGSRVFGVTPDFQRAFRFGSNKCLPELEPVFETFKDTFKRGYQVESQLCVYSKGEKVRPTNNMPALLPCGVLYDVLSDIKGFDDLRRSSLARHGIIMDLFSRASAGVQVC